MEQREKRDRKWLNASPNSPKNKVEYDITNKGLKKESFNFGKVPFGSHSKQQALFASRVTHDVPLLVSPGPGQYGSAMSPRDDSIVLGRQLSPGYSFS